MTRESGPTEAARALLASADAIDLHLDLDVPRRLLGLDPHVRRSAWPWMFGHTDWPRIIESGFTGVVYDLPTNPFRWPSSRVAVLAANLDAVRADIGRNPRLALVRGRADYEAARAAGRLAVWLAVQGGNAFLADPGELDGPIGDDLLRATLVHLTSSGIGGTSSPLGRDRGLGPVGKVLVERLNARRVLVDLAHAGPRTFADALDVHDRTLPPVVSHTGVAGVNRSWRNIDDGQIRAIADRGGVVGILYHSAYLEPLWPHARGRRAAIVDHLEHTIRVGGEQVAAIGTDFDGAITPPADLPDVTGQVHLVGDMLARGWSEDRIRRVLGGNALRVIGAMRP